MWSSYFWLEEFPKDSIEDAFTADMEDMDKVHDSCNVVLVGGYEQEDVIDAMDLTAIISQNKEWEPKRVGKWIFYGHSPTWSCIHAFVNFPSSSFL